MVGKKREMERDLRVIIHASQHNTSALKCALNEAVTGSRKESMCDAR